MGARRDSAGTPATALLDREGVDYRVRAYAHDPRSASYGLEAAEALDVDAGSVFKTLLADVDGELVVAVVPVTCSLDLKALARVIEGKRARMAEPAVAERATGYVLGGISPFGQRRRHRTVVDTSASGWVAVLVSGGRRGLDLELSPDDLVRLTDATLADVARP